MIVIEDADYFIRLLPLPGSVGGFLLPNDDSTYSMYLNENHDPETKIDDYIHELEHILDDDLYGDRDIRDVEGFPRILP